MVSHSLLGFDLLARYECVLKLIPTGIASFCHISLFVHVAPSGHALSLERKVLIFRCATATKFLAMSQDSSSPVEHTRRASKSKKNDGESDADIRNFAPVARIMKMALPENAKIAKEAKECMQECVSEFISFITSEGWLRILYLVRVCRAKNR